MGYGVFVGVPAWEAYRVGFSMGPTAMLVGHCGTGVLVWDGVKAKVEMRGGWLKMGTEEAAWDGVGVRIRVSLRVK